MRSTLELYVRCHRVPSVVWRVNIGQWNCCRSNLLPFLLEWHENHYPRGTISLHDWRSRTGWCISKNVFSYSIVEPIVCIGGAFRMEIAAAYELLILGIFHSLELNFIINSQLDSSSENVSWIERHILFCRLYWCRSGTLRYHSLI